LGEYDSAGTPIYETVYLGNLPVGVIKQSGTAAQGNIAVTLYNLHADHLATPRMITRQSDQAIVWRWDSAEAFGGSAANQNPSGLGSFAYNQRFPGQVFDAETGLLQNWNREYDPRQGRYRQSDPIGLGGGINTYSYVKGNPLMYFDPLGLDLWCKDRSLNIRVPMPLGQSGGCGDAATDKYIPDLYPEACYAHDVCYANPGPSRSQCDSRFLRDMVLESGPQLNILGPLIYYGGVRFFGRDAFRKARQ
jgi:RHS repeat-associated protein